MKIKVFFVVVGIEPERARAVRKCAECTFSGECRSPAPESSEGGRRQKRGEAERFRPPAPGRLHFLRKMQAFFHTKKREALYGRDQSPRRPHWPPGGDKDGKELSISPASYNNAFIMCCSLTMFTFICKLTFLPANLSARIYKTLYY